MGRFEQIFRSHAHAWIAEGKDTAVVYLGIVGLFLLGSLLIRNTSSRIKVGGDEYERRRRRRFIGIILIILAVICLMITEYPAINAPPTSSRTYKEEQTFPAVTSSQTRANLGQSQVDLVPLLRQSFQLMQEKQLDAALEKVNAVLQVAPQNSEAYGLRGNIYAEKKLWDQAEQDFETVLKLDSKNAQIQFDLAEIKFLQKEYDNARPGFAALEQDPALGDLAKYKVFLCDLFGGHEDVAAQELDAFNEAGSNASYYFANGAWDLVHHQTEEARGWLMSAANIYAPIKFRLYAVPLITLGYMPLPPAPSHE